MQGSSLKSEAQRLEHLIDGILKKYKNRTKD